ncbi:MAG: hypothetical protein LC650_00860 [Actinobacteria bacterium]|nr:hypothetical protein [Actinomycetota bacterium]
MKELVLYIPEKDYDRVIAALSYRIVAPDFQNLQPSVEAASEELLNYAKRLVKDYDRVQHEQVFTFEPPEVLAPEEWVQPGGDVPAYSKGDVVQHNRAVWISSTDDNVWVPGESGWHAYGEDPEEGPFAWVAPTGAHDSYQQGDQVTHNGQTWQSEINDNVWEPGVSGWVVV